jgi:hypothetical protein
MEADAHYGSNLLNQPQITQTHTDMVLFWDHLGWGGGFIRFAPSAAAKQFYVDLTKRMRLSGQDDQFTLNEMIGAGGIHSRNISEFDKCLFKSGAALQPDLSHHYTAKCAGIEPIVQQHNWIIGAQTKIKLAKSRGEWFLEEKDYRKCRPRDLRLVVMTMNRVNSLSRLLDSLYHAYYNPSYPFVDLQVNVDVAQEGPDSATIEFLNKFEWPHGFLEINVQDHSVGIYGQWVDSWPSERYPPWLYRAVVLLEDDLEVSPHFAQWFIEAHETYKAPRVGAITGMRAQLVAKSGAQLPADQLVPPGVSAFAYKLIATWSMSPTHAMWTQFRAWVKEKRADRTFVPEVTGIVPSEWYMDFLAHGKEAGMWEMWFVRFASDFNYYTVYPWVENGAVSIVSNWREKGLHYTGDAPSLDFPLLQTWQPRLLLQEPLPFVEWDMAFYVCLTGDLYGAFSNQLLTLVWGSQYAKEKDKFLSIQSAATVHENRKYLLENWDTIFEEDAILNLAMDYHQPDSRKCALLITFEDMFSSVMNSDLRMKYLKLPLPIVRGDIQNAAIQNIPDISVHGRSLENNCMTYNHVCITAIPSIPESEELCDYNQSRILEVFGISQDESITLFTDNQNDVYDATYENKDQNPFIVQLWTMVLSPRHIGNSRSTMDYIIALWKRQLGMAHTIEPKGCYQS